MEQLQAVVENRTGFCLDPRTKLLLMAVVATAEFLYSHTAFMIAVAMIPFVLLLTNRQYKTATVFFCLFAAGLFVQAIQNSVQFPMIVNMLVVLLVGLVLRLFPAFVMGPILSSPPRQRVHYRTWPDAHWAADHHSALRPVSFYPYHAGGVGRHQGRHADAGGPVRDKEILAKPRRPD